MIRYACFGNRGASNYGSSILIFPVEEVVSCPQSLYGMAKSACHDHDKAFRGKAREKRPGRLWYLAPPVRRISSNASHSKPVQRPNTRSALIRTMVGFSSLWPLRQHTRNQTAHFSAVRHHVTPLIFESNFLGISRPRKLYCNSYIVFLHILQPGIKRSAPFRGASYLRKIVCVNA